MLREEFKLNQPQASDGWLTRDTLWLVSKTVSDKLRAHLLAQGIDGIPSSNTAVFNVLQDHGIAQPTPDGKAIWKATVASDAGWSHSFTFLKLSPALIWDAVERPASFAGQVQVEQEQEGPVQQTDTVADPARAVPNDAAQVTLAAGNNGVGALLDLLDMALDSPAPPSGPPIALEPKVDPEDKPLSPPTATARLLDQAEPSGEHFMAWLARGVQTRKLIVNDAKALVHTVCDTAYLVSPGIFQRYVQEHTKTAVLAKQDQLTDWQWMQKRFERLQLHRKQQNGLNIWTCTVTGPRKSRRLHGYLLEDPRILFADLPPNNPYLTLFLSAASAQESPCPTAPSTTRT